MVESRPGLITALFADLDGTRIPEGDRIHPGDVAAEKKLKEHGIKSVNVTARNASRMDEVWRQTGRQDSILGGGTTFYVDGTEVRERRIWLPRDNTAAIVSRIVMMETVHYIGYNAQPMTPSREDLLKDQPAEESPVVCFTLDAHPDNREIIEYQLAELGLHGLFVEIAPYRASRERHYAQIALANKEIGVRTYQEHKEIDVSESAGIGDSGPDVGIFARTTLRYAVDNSTPELLGAGYPYERVRSVYEQGYSQAVDSTIEHNRLILQG